MHTFALQKISVIKGIQRFEQLMVDGIGQLDEFEKDVMGTTYSGELKKLFTYMEYLSNNNTLPEKIFRELKPSKNPKEYEFKSKHLRIYVTQQFSGKIVVIGGYKNSQKQDIKKFRSLKKQYLDSL